MSFQRGGCRRLKPPCRTKLGNAMVLEYLQNNNDFSKFQFTPITLVRSRKSTLLQSISLWAILLKFRLLHFFNILTCALKQEETTQSESQNCCFFQHTRVHATCHSYVSTEDLDDCMRYTAVKIKSAITVGKRGSTDREYNRSRKTRQHSSRYYEGGNGFVCAAWQ